MKRTFFYEATLWLEAFSLTSTTAVILLDMSLVLISWRKKKAQQVVESLPGMLWYGTWCVTSPWIHNILTPTLKNMLSFLPLYDFENCSQTFLSRKEVSRKIYM